MTPQAHVTGQSVTVKLSGAGRTRPLVGDQPFLMRVVAGDARDPAFLVQRQNDVETCLHLVDLGQHLRGRLAQVPLMQRLFGGAIVTSHAYRPVIADEFHIFRPGLVLVGHLRVAVKTLLPQDLSLRIYLLMGVILRVLVFIVASEADVDSVTVGCASQNGLLQNLVRGAVLALTDDVMAGEAGQLGVLQRKPGGDFYIPGWRVIDRMRVHFAAVVMAAAQVAGLAFVFQVELCFCDGRFFVALQAISAVKVNVGRVGNAALDNESCRRFTGRRGSADFS